MPPSGRKDRLPPNDGVEPMPPSDGAARKPLKDGAIAFGGTRPKNSRSIRILVSASRLSSCPTGVLLPVGSTPSSAVGAAPKGVRTVAAAGGRSLSGGVLISSGQRRPPSNGGRALASRDPPTFAAAPPHGAPQQEAGRPSVRGNQDRCSPLAFRLQTGRGPPHRGKERYPCGRGHGATPRRARGRGPSLGRGPGQTGPVACGRSRYAACESSIRTVR